MDMQGRKWSDKAEWHSTLEELMQDEPGLSYDLDSDRIQYQNPPASA